MRRYSFVLLAVVFVGLVVLANWLASAYLVPVGFGEFAPAGVFCIGAVLVLRDWLQQLHRLARTMLLVYVGGLASWGIGSIAGWTDLQAVAIDARVPVDVFREPSVG